MLSAINSVKEVMFLAFVDIFSTKFPQFLMKYHNFGGLNSCGFNFELYKSKVISANDILLSLSKGGENK